MNNYLSRLHYAKLRYLEFPGSAVIGVFKPVINIIKIYFIAKLVFFQILFNKTSQKVNLLYDKDQDKIFVVHAMLTDIIIELYTSFVHISSSFSYFYLEVGM